TDITNVVSVNAATSHPHKTSNGTIYNLGSSVITGLKYHVMKIPPPTSAEGMYRKHTANKSEFQYFTK
ncbi:hypothetical protein NPIL_250051, partial [Nephila pilipes]